MRPPTAARRQHAVLHHTIYPRVRAEKGEVSYKLWIGPYFSLESPEVKKRCHAKETTEPSGKVKLSVIFDRQDV